MRVIRAVIRAPSVPLWGARALALPPSARWGALVAMCRSLKAVRLGALWRVRVRRVGWATATGPAADVCGNRVRGERVLTRVRQREGRLVRLVRRRGLKRALDLLLLLQRNTGKCRVGIRRGELELEWLGGEGELARKRLEPVRLNELLRRSGGNCERSGGVLLHALQARRLLCARIDRRLQRAMLVLLELERFMHGTVAEAHWERAPEEKNAVQ